MKAKQALAKFIKWRTQVIPLEITRGLENTAEKTLKFAIKQTSGKWTYEKRVRRGSPRTYTRLWKSIPGWYPNNDPLIINIEHGELVKRWRSLVVSFGNSGGGSFREDQATSARVLNYDPRAMRLIKGNDKFMPRPFNVPIEIYGETVLAHEISASVKRIIEAW